MDRLDVAAAIVADAAERTHLSMATMLGERRSPPIARARYAAAWTINTALGLPLSRIAAALGRRDHSSAHHALARAEELRARDAAFRKLTDALLAAEQSRAAERARLAAIEAEQRRADDLARLAALAADAEQPALTPNEEEVHAMPDIIDGTQDERIMTLWDEGKSKEKIHRLTRIPMGRISDTLNRLHTTPNRDARVEAAAAKYGSERLIAAINASGGRFA